MITPIGAVTAILSPLKILAAAIFEPPSDTEVSDDVVKSYTLYSNVLLLISTLVIIGEVIEPVNRQWDIVGVLFDLAIHAEVLAVMDKSICEYVIPPLPSFIKAKYGVFDISVKLAFHNKQDSSNENTVVSSQFNDIPVNFMFLALPLK